MALKLPDSIGGKKDLILATREIEQILTDRIQDEVRTKQGVATKGTAAGHRALKEILDENNLKESTETLKQILAELETYKEKAPRLRISFSQEPDEDVYRKVVSWFRREIGPTTLVQIGVQPNIGGGFVLQTPVHRYDMSLKTKVLNSTPKFLEVLHRYAGNSEPQTLQSQASGPDPESAPEAQPSVLTADPEQPSESQEAVAPVPESVEVQDPETQEQQATVEAEKTGETS